MKRVDKVLWAVESQRLLTYKQRHKEIPARMARESAQRLGIRERSVYRKLKMPPRPRPRFELEARHQLYVVQAKSIRGAVELAQAAGDQVSESTFRDRWSELPSGVRHGLRYGEEAMHAHQGYAAFEAEEPNEVVQADTMFPAVMCRERKEWLALSPDERALVPEPRLRVFGGIDDKTRYMRMSDVDITPTNAEVVSSCMADAVRGETVDGTFVGGTIRTLRWDNALEQLAHDVTTAGHRLGTEKMAPVMPFAGWMKGKIERFWRTANDEFWSRQPGWYGDDESPFVKSLAADELKTAAELAADYAIWLAHYNRTRIHSSLKSTPLDAWRAAAVEIVMPPDEAIALAHFRTTKTLEVRKLGVKFNGVIYAALPLGDIVGEEVQIAYSRRDTSVIYVLRDGVYFCTAKDSALLTDHERMAIYSHREAGTRLVIGIRQEAVKSTAVKRDGSTGSATPTKGHDEPTAEDEYLAFLATSNDQEAS